MRLLSACFKVLGFVSDPGSYKKENLSVVSEVTLFISCVLKMAAKSNTVALPGSHLLHATPLRWPPAFQDFLFLSSVVKQELKLITTCQYL